MLLKRLGAQDEYLRLSHGDINWSINRDDAYDLTHGEAAALKLVLELKEPLSSFFVVDR